jgi:hypothetical protein
MIPSRDHICNESLIQMLVLSSNYHSLPYTGVRVKEGFDLSQFDSNTTNLHLMIDTPNKF